MNKDVIGSRFDAVMRFFLYVLIFWIPYSTAVIESCVITGAALWIVKRILLADWSFGNKNLKEYIIDKLKMFIPKNSPINLPAALFFLVCIISSFYSPLPRWAYPGLIRKTAEWFAIYFLVIECFKTRQQILAALGILVFTAFSTAVDSIVQYHITGVDIFNGHELTQGVRATAGFNHPNGLGGYLTIVIPFVFAFGIAGHRRTKLKILSWAVLIILIWSMFITYSRGAWMAAAAGAVVLLCVVDSKRLKSGLVVAAGLAVLLSAATSPILKKKLDLVFEKRKDSIQYRLALWEDSLLMIKDRPWIGHGVNTFMEQFQKYRRTYKDNFPYTATHAHNCYLQLAAEVGIFGLIFFFWILFDMFKAALRSISSHSGDVILKISLIGLLAGCSAFLIHSAVDTNLYSLRLVAHFWVSAGIMAVTSVLLKENNINNIHTA